METVDGGGLAGVLDPAIAQFFSEVERAASQRTESTPPIPNFAGIAPHATRRVKVELGSTAPLAEFTGPGLSAAWAFPATGQGEKAWWTLAIAGSGPGGPRVAAAVREAGEAAQMGGGGGVKRRWIWLLASRPRELESTLAPGVPDFQGIRAMMRRINELGCRLSISENGDIEGELTLQLFEGGGR
jgi:hypothetical protein